MNCTSLKLAPIKCQIDQIMAIPTICQGVEKIGRVKRRLRHPNMLINVQPVIIMVLTRRLAKVNPGPNDDLVPFLLPGKAQIRPGTLCGIKIAATSLVRRLN